MSYTKIPNSEAPDDEESNLESQQHSGLDLGTSRQKRSLYVLLWLFSLACTSFSTRWYYQVLPSRDPSCSRNLPYDSTSMVHNDIKLHNDWITRNGTLWNDVTPSPFRGPPSPQVDAAWESLWMPNPILISEAEMQQHHLSTKGAVRWPKDTTGKTYIGHMDIFHLMHCLNEVRKGNWFNYYRNNETLDPTYYVHQSHCLDVLRQELMCTGSLNLFRYQWQESQHNPWPDFNVERQCRRWEDIVDWKKSHQMSDEDMRSMSHMSRPDGDYLWPLPPDGQKLVKETDAWLAANNLTTS